MQPGATDSLRAIRPAEAGRGDPGAGVRLASRVLGVMRSRSLVANLVVPVIAAVVVGVAAVAIVGGGGTGSTGGAAASSALATGFPPARLAGADFTGSVATTPVVLASVAASAGTEVVAGSAADGPALWVSDDGGSAWRRPLLAGPAALTRAGSGQFTAVAHGAAGWLAVGAMRAGQRGPLMAGSPDGRTWTVGRGMSLPGAAATAVAAGPAGYVIVGNRVAGGGGGMAVAWYAPGLAGWRQEPVASPAATVPTAMNAVTATARGFTAVGSAGQRPAAWVSVTGRSWRLVAVPVPDGAASAALDYVAANGSGVIAAGTAVSSAGASRPFTVVSGDGGATWAPLPLPAPAGAIAAATVTGLTAAGRGFVAVGMENAPGGANVVVWTMAATGADTGPGTAWTVVTPQGTGLAGPGTQALTALTAQGVTLTGVGFTATSAAQQPTLWQSPVRY